MRMIYGLKACDSCRKATAWLKARGIGFTFHDLRDSGLERSVLEDWTQRVDWEVLLNRKSTTWRSIAETERQNLDRSKAVDLMLAYPTLIKRPVLDTGTELLIGFSADVYAESL